MKKKSIGFVFGCIVTASLLLGGASAKVGEYFRVNNQRIMPIELVEFDNFRTVYDDDAVCKVYESENGVAMDCNFRNVFK